MALSRRPARFESRHSMPSPNTTIAHEKLHLLRAAATRVYINKDDRTIHLFMEDHQEEDNGGNNKVEAQEVAKADPEHGVKLLAAAAAEMAKAHPKPK